jgi:hypothetical protein
VCLLIEDERLHKNQHEFILHRDEFHISPVIKRCFPLHDDCEAGCRSSRKHNARYEKQFSSEAVVIPAALWTGTHIHFASGEK